MDKKLLEFCRTDRQIETLEAVIKYGSNNKAAASLQVDRRIVDRTIERIKDYAKSQGYVTSNDVNRYEKALAEASGNKKKAAHILGITYNQLKKDLDRLEIKGFYKTVPKRKRYVITAAQNATPVKESFFKSILQYCKFNDAELVVVPLRYKNATSIWTSSQANADWWDERLEPYLCDSRFDINNNLTVLADIKTQPTAVDPLSGFESISQHKSALFGHTKISLKTIPVIAGGYPKLIATTGCVTQKNYTETKTGKKGDFHHTFGAAVVEVKNNEIFHMRHVNAVRDGSFIDLEYEYTPTCVYYAEPAAGLVLGDWHGHAVDKTVIKGTFTSGSSMVNRLDPKVLVWHDALDFFSRTHHHIKNPFVNLAKHNSGIDDVKQELVETFALIEKLADGRKSIFPYSNHPDALYRWIRDADWKLDPKNAEVYLETALEMVRSTHMNGCVSETIDPFEYWGKKLLSDPDNYVFLNPDDPYSIKDITLDMHGHLGANGSRGGSAKTFAKLGSKSITGHSHGPEIFEGAYRVGTSSVLKQEYNKGPSSWLQTHCVIYANGKRALLNLIGGEYTIG